MTADEWLEQPSSSWLSLSILLLGNRVQILGVYFLNKTITTLSVTVTHHKMPYKIRLHYLKSCLVNEKTSTFVFFGSVFYSASHSCWFWSFGTVKEKKRIIRFLILVSNHVRNKLNLHERENESPWVSLCLHISPSQGLCQVALWLTAADALSQVFRVRSLVQVFRDKQ